MGASKNILIETERRRKISEKMKDNFKRGIIKGWKINSDKKRRSYPEKFFIEVFKNNGLYEKYDIVEKYSYGKYFIDFLFVELKLVFEIDGEQHFKVESIEYDKIRDSYFLENGFRVYRVRWKNVFDNTKNEIQEFLDFLKSINTYRKYTIDEISYKKKNNINRKIRKNNICECGINIYKDSKRCKKCWIKFINKKEKVKYVPNRKGKCLLCSNPIYGLKYCMTCKSIEDRKIKVRPSYDQLIIDIEELGYSGTGRKYGVSDNCIRKWIKK